jgi:signal transduction histidine kinase
MIKRVIRSLIFASLILLALPVQAQTDTLNGYHVQHFTDEDGLPQNSINDLLFDDNGFLWLASQGGLIRFDGNSFKLFTPADKPALESDVLFLGKGDADAIYFQTRDRQLYSYPGKTSQTVKLVNAAPLRNPILLNTRRQLFDFSHFLADEQPGEAPGSRKRIFDDLFEQKASFYTLDPSHVYLIYSDSLYYYSGNRLEKLCGFSEDIRQFLTLDKKLYILSRDSVLSVYEDGKKTGGAGLIGGDLRIDAGRARGGNRQPDTYRLFAGGVNHMRVNNRLYRLYRDSTGRLNAGFLLNLDFVKNISRIAYEPDLDMLLIGTETEGFYFLRKSRFGAPNFPAPLQEQLSQYLFGPMALLPDGKEILNTRFLFSPEGKFSHVKEDIRVRQQCLYIDKKGNAWGSLGNLPRKMTTDLKALKVFPVLDAQIVDYTEDSLGTLWCLTRRSLWRLNGDTFQLMLSNSQLAVSGANESFSMVRPNILWIANMGGLFEYDMERKQARTIQDLDGAHVRSIHVCKDRSILLGTYGQGYFYYYHGRIFRMPLDKNAFLLTAHCFLEDKKGMIWIPCNKGLFKVPKADLDSWCDSSSSQIYYYYFGRQDGLKTNEFNGGFNSSGLIRPDGFAALLSMKGIVCFYTDSLRSDFPKGRVEINTIEIDGKTSQKTDSIELDPGYNSLLIEISCPFWGNRNNLYLEYCLQGLSNEWKDVEADRVINLSRLGPGNYTLRVRKVNGFGKNNYLYREWNISVIPHFWQTSWFIPLVILGFILIMVMVVHLWLKLTEKRKEVRIQTEKLKATVVEQKETLEKLQQSQKALLQSGKMKEKLISLVIHDLRSPIRFLSMLAGDLHDNQQNYSEEEIKERAFWIKKGTNDIYNFSEDFLLWVTSQKNNFSISKRLFPIRPLIQEIHEFFSDQLQQKGNTLFYEASEDLSIYSDPHILITIIRNLVDNANKYTDRGNINIHAYEEISQTVISISDTGKGMNRQQIDSFLNGKEEDLKSGSQLGHKFVYDLSKRIDGVVSIESKEKEGTVVTLRFSKAGEPATV